MTIARYFSEPCPACELAERFLSDIEKRYHVIRYRIDRERRLPAISDWWKECNGRVPALQLDGMNGSLWFVGVGPIEKLAKVCKDWVGMPIYRRNTAAPVTAPMDLRPKKIQEVT